MAHDPHEPRLTRRHILQMLGAGAGIGLLPRGAAAALAQSTGGGAGKIRVEDWPEVGGKGRLERLERDRHSRDVSERRV